MAQQLTKAECDAYFAPALGAFVMTQATDSYKTVSFDFAKASEKTYLTKLTNIEVAKISASLQVNAVTSLGTTCFGFVFEKYKKHCAQATEDVGRAFGLNKLSVQTEFKTRCPSANITIWKPNKKGPEYWFSSMIRNAFAHGQWEKTNPGNAVPTINLKNFLPGKNGNEGECTFDVTMSLADLRQIIVAALYSFIQFVRPIQQDPADPGRQLQWPPAQPDPDPPSHETLYRLLEAEIRLSNLKPLFDDL